MEAEAKYRANLTARVATRTIFENAHNRVEIIFRNGRILAANVVFGCVRRRLRRGRCGLLDHDGLSCLNGCGSGHYGSFSDLNGRCCGLFLYSGGEGIDGCISRLLCGSGKEGCLKLLLFPFLVFKAGGNDGDA